MLKTQYLLFMFLFLLARINELRTDAGCWLLGICGTTLIKRQCWLRAFFSPDERYCFMRCFEAEIQNQFCCILAKIMYNLFPLQWVDMVFGGAEV